MARLFVTVCLQIASSVPSMHSVCALLPGSVTDIRVHDWQYQSNDQACTFKPLFSHSLCTLLPCSMTDIMA